MKNIEYYQKEIRDKYNYKLRYSANAICKYDLADTLFEVWVEHADGNTEVMTWLYEEHKEPILDDVEKAYLRAVIEPFRQYNKIIFEKEDMCSECCIRIRFIKKNDYDWAFRLPPFRKGTMYKGMELFKEYTLKELEL